MTVLPIPVTKSRMVRIINILEDTSVDGPGFRTSIYAAGCLHHCPNCHNPGTWDFDSGTDIETEDLLKIIEADPFAYVTFSGGDPLYQAKGFAELAKAIKERTNKNIWCYTGFCFEQLLGNDDAIELLKYIDILVDGPFIEAEKDEELLFRGSRNQRLIDVQQSLCCREVVLFDINNTTSIRRTTISK